MLVQLPLPDAALHERILALPRGPGRRLHQIAHPGMPAGLDLAGVELGVFVVDPAGAEGQFFAGVLEVPVPVAVGSDQGAGFGVACIRGCERGGGGLFGGGKGMEGRTHVLHLVAEFFPADAAQVAEGAEDGRHRI